MKIAAIVTTLLLSLIAAMPAAAQLCNPLDPLPATVLRDAHGVPHIFALDEDALNLTNGYVEAQDRLFELEILRHAGRGTLSDILGASYLEMDVATRRDFYTEAERQAQFDALPLADQRSLSQFAAGVSGYICEARLDPSKLPAEHAALGFLPDDWMVTDSVAVADYEIGAIGATRGGVDRGSYNQLIELAPTLFSVNVVPPGQSGLVNAATLAQIQGAPDEASARQVTDDAHLTDQLELYERFEYKPMPFTLEEVQAAQ
jgi:acyl-homoserine lactone acylase PvdQ